MRRRDDVDQGGVTARRNSLEVAREHRFELGRVLRVGSDQRVLVRVDDLPVGTEELHAERAVDQHARADERVETAELSARELLREVGLRQLVPEQRLFDEPGVRGRVALRVGRGVMRDEPEQAGARGRDDHGSRGRKPQVETGRRSHRPSLTYRQRPAFCDPQSSRLTGG